MDIPLPPPQFDFEPPSYYVQHISEAELRRMCKKGPELEMLGCTFGALIFVRKGLSGRTERLVVRHEKGHVNGWKHQ